MAASGSNVPSPNFPGQLRYILQWFGEFSTLQRSDFLPILVEQFRSESNLNGLPPTRADDAPSEVPHPTIFQCRLKFVIEWTCTWTLRQKWELLNALRAVDPDFVSEFLAECPLQPEPFEET